MALSSEVKVRFFPPSDQLRRYFTTFYHTEWSVADGQRITDYLLPEWANLRFHTGCGPDAETIGGMRMAESLFPVTGPSSQPVRFSIGTSRMWGVGLLPLGWAKFIGVPASNFANTVFDGSSHPDFARFMPLADELFGGKRDLAAEASRMDRYFLSLADEDVPDEDRIVAIHAALVDPEVATVAQLADRAGASQRTVERICHRAFGFSPKLLLRRQRFMRSLVHFVLDPSLKWIGAIDGHYHDQAQFVRDFRQFMGMSPRQYAALPKPLLGAIMRERSRMAGSAAQALDAPTGVSLLD